MHRVARLQYLAMRRVTGSEEVPESASRIKISVLQSLSTTFNLERRKVKCVAGAYVSNFKECGGRGTDGMMPAKCISYSLCIQMPTPRFCNPMIIMIFPGQEKTDSYGRLRSAP